MTARTPESIRVSDEHMSAALDQLLDGRSKCTRALLGGGTAYT